MKAFGDVSRTQALALARVAEVEIRAIIAASTI